MHEVVSPPAVGPHPAVRVLHRCGSACHFAWRAAGRGFVEFYKSENLTFAASIAYYTLLSLFPFLLLVLAILSRFAMTGGSGERLLQQMVGSALPSQFEFLVRQMQELAAAPIKLSVVGTIIMLWASMGVFGAVTSAVNHAWGVERAYGFFKHKLIAFVMMMAAGVLAVIALILMSTAQVVETTWFDAFLVNHPALGLVVQWVSRNLPTPLFIAVVGLIYYFVPNAKVRLRDVWFGAVIAGLFWRLAFAGFAWYVRDLSRFSVHGSIAAVVVFLVWVYLSAVIFLYGVEVTAAYARLRKHLPQQVPAAPARDL